MNIGRNTYNALHAQAEALEAKAWELKERCDATGGVRYRAFADAWDAANAAWAEVVAFDREHGISDAEYAEIAAQKAADKKAAEEKSAQEKAEHEASVAAYWARYEAQQQLKQELTAKIPQLKAAVLAAGKLLKACFDARAWPELDYKRRTAMSDLEDAQNRLRWIP